MNQPSKRRWYRWTALGCLALGILSIWGFGWFPQLSEEKSAARTVEGQVTFVNRGESVFFLQNETGGYRVECARMPDGLDVGEEVEVYGSPESTSGVHELQAVTVEFAERRPKVTPVQWPNARLASDLAKESGLSKRLVEVAGVVREAHFGLAGMALRLRTRETDLSVRILAPAALQADTLIDSELQVTGVLDSELAADGRSRLPLLLVQSEGQVQIQRAAERLQTYRLVRVQDIPGLSTEEVRHRVRLRGVIDQGPAGQMWLDDGTGRVKLPANQEEDLAGRKLDVWGFVKRSGSSVELEDTDLRDTGQSIEMEQSAGKANARLATVQAVHRLPPAVAGLGLPVTLQGVVTYVYSSGEALFLQDATGGIYVTLLGNAGQSVHGGQRVTVSGVTAEGGFAPVVAKAVVQAEGEGAWPTPAAVDWDQLLSGRLDSTWVELEGIVHAIVSDEGKPYAIAEQAGNSFRIYLPRKEDLPASLIDSRIRARGVCATIFNSRRQSLGAKVMSPGPSYLTVLSAGVPVEQLAVRSIVDLQQFAPGVEPGRRWRVQAVVTKVGQGGRFYLRDRTGAVRADSPRMPELNVGDLVDAVGFLKQDGAGPILRDVTARLLKRNVPVVAKPVSAEEVASAGYEAQLLELRAVVLDNIRTEGTDILVVQSGRTIFRVVLEEGRIDGAEKGTLVRLQGVAELTQGRLLRPPFTLLLRSARDVSVLEEAPWWSSKPVGWVLLAIGGLASLVVVWALLLRRQVKHQTQVIRKQLAEAEQLRHEAEAASRAKGEFLANMSHEIRTPLNGVLGMTELALMEPLAVNVREYLEISQQSGLGLLQVINDVLDISKIEAGKMTIEVAPLDLMDLLEQAVALFKPAAGQKAVRLQLDYPVHTPRHFLGDAVRIRQIALNLLGNAMKFTEQGEVVVRVRSKVLDEQRRTLRIEVRDTGIGIPVAKQAQLFRTFEQADASTTRRYGGTGLGLSISKRLADLMGATIGCVSVPGEGSVFTLEIALLLDDHASERDENRAARSSSQLAGRAPSVSDNIYRTG